MKARKIKDGVHWMGAIDWDRRLFDCLIPLPDGTSYNAYLVEGTQKTALLDSVDPSMTQVLLNQLKEVKRVDYLVAQHAEQDHSGSLPALLEKYPQAKLVTTPKGKGMLMDLLHIPEDRFQTVSDQETLSLGGKTLRFIHTPWVHWPETMVTWLEEDRILFTCDFFGSHLATGDLYAQDEARVYDTAKRYYAEIMMPFSNIIVKHLEKLGGLDISVIAPSHGPVYDRPAFITDAYRQWTSAPPRNLVVLPYVSMHNSTRLMVEYLAGALVERGVAVEQFDLTSVDLGRLAMVLVDAATLVAGSPTVLGGAHPLAVNAAVLAGALKPKLKFATVIGSYGWADKATEQLAGLLGGLKLEVLTPVNCKGLPGDETFAALDTLADTIAAKHRELGLEAPGSGVWQAQEVPVTAAS